MSISVLDNFSIKKQAPNVERDLFETVADMVAFSENYLPDVFECNVKEDGKRYRYMRSNAVDDTTGKWREVTGGDVDMSEYYTKVTTDELLAAILQSSKEFTDEQIELLKKDGAFACDEKPVYDDGKIHYKENGEDKETTRTDAWFYYVIDNVLYQTIFINGADKTIISGGGVDFSEFIKKTDGAKAIAFEDSTHPLWTDVDKAIKGIIAKIEYILPEIKSFSVTPSTTTYEKGQSVSDLQFEWAYNKDVTSQSLSDVTLTDETDRSGTFSGPLTTTKTFTLTASDGENSVKKDLTIAFRDKLYYGSAAIPTDYDSAFILGLSGKQFTTAKKGSYTMTVGSGEYGFIAFPSSFGNLASVFIGGFETTVENCGQISFTNASGGVTLYNIYRTGRSGLGTITMEVK